MQIVEYPVEIADSPDRCRFYDAMLENGTAPRLALMLACQQPPGTKASDRVFQQFNRNKMDSMDERSRTAYVRAARRSGIDTTGRHYIGGLGKPSDPSAWVSDLDDVKKVAEIKNLEVTGVFERSIDESRIKPPKEVRLAPHIVDQIAAARLAGNAKLREQVKKNPKKMQELREQVVEQHGKKNRRPVKRLGG